jgi:hypothetical protein
MKKAKKPFISFENKATGGFDRADRDAEQEDVRTAHEKNRDYDGEKDPYADDGLLHFSLR